MYNQNYQNRMQIIFPFNPLSANKKLFNSAHMWFRFWSVQERVFLKWIPVISR